MPSMHVRKPHQLSSPSPITSSNSIPMPTSRVWTLAVHEAGHCVMAYVLDLGISGGVIRPNDNSGNVWWRHAGRRYERFRDEPHSRAVIEADALVALAGAAAQWLYRDGSVRAIDLRHDDRVAASVLQQLEQTDTVISHWREYLRQRAVRMLSEQQNQALIARLAGLFVERLRLRGNEIYEFLEREESRVHEYVLDNSATIEDYVGLIGHAVFSQPIENLALGTRINGCLRAARISTIGRLLQHSSYDLSPIKGLGKDSVRMIEEAVIAAGFQLATYPCRRPS
jgi:RNA polymerase alpha subunit